MTRHVLRRKAGSGRSGIVVVVLAVASLCYSQDLPGYSLFKKPKPDTKDKVFQLEFLTTNMSAGGTPITMRSVQGVAIVTTKRGGHATVQLTTPPGLGISSLPLTVKEVPGRPASRVWVPELKSYTGCGATPGTPQIIEGHYENVPATKRYWAVSGNQTLGAAASSIGAYLLSSAQLKWNVPFTLDTSQEILDPLTIVTPVSSPAPPDTASAIPVQWQLVDRAVSYEIYAVAVSGTGTSQKTVLWKSGLLSATTTSCTIPAGIFTGMPYFQIMVTAWGPERTYRGKGYPVLVKVSSCAWVVLGTPQQ